MIINLDGEKPKHVSQELWDMLQKEFENIYNDDSEDDNNDKRQR